MSDIINFTPNPDKYRKLADEYAERGDFTRALSFLFSAKSIRCDYKVLMDIADVYADMGLLELSNKYWYYYMDKAPKDKVSIAYEELAINYFYMDNYWASSFYFHKKLDTDGHISKEGLDKEIIDFFSGEEMKKTAYRLVYPFERADYSYNVKIAKHFLALGAFGEAKKPLEEIPESVRNEEQSGELAMACFMSDDLDGAEKACRNSLEINGENVTSYCHLSTVYNMREDADKADYYYQKALSIRKGEKGEEYNLATCAIERGDHFTAKECLIKILEDRPHEASMRFFYGISLINLGEYQKAKKELEKTYRLNPDDAVCYYYLKLVDDLENGVVGAEKLLPLKYEKELPKKVAKKYSQELKSLVDEPMKISSALKKKEIRKIVEWGLYFGEGQTPRDAVFILSNDYSSYSKSLIKTALLDLEVLEEIKRVLIYVLIVSGVKEKFGVTAGSFYLKIKPKKLLCEKSPEGAIYFSAYALCMARVVFWEFENLDVIGQKIDKIYKAFSGKVTEAEVTNEELAALVLSECGFKWVKNPKDVTKLFEITPQKLTKLTDMLKGENHD